MSAWLHRTTRNVAAHAVRTERRRRTREELAATMHELPADPSDIADWSQLAPVIDDAIDGLNERDRTAILFRFFEGKSFVEIGAALQLREDAARMRVDRALNKLRSILARRGIASSSSALTLALANHATVAAPLGLSTSTTAAAVASASSITSGFTLLAAMSTSKITAIAVTTLATMPLGTAIHQANRVARATSSLATAREQSTQAKQNLRNAVHEFEAAQANVSRATPVATDESAVAPDIAPDGRGQNNAHASPSAVSKESEWNPVVEGQTLLARHPDLRHALIAYANGVTNYRFAAFYETAGLTAEEIADFQRLWLGSAGLSRAIGPERKNITITLRDETSHSRRDSQIRELLGADRYQLYLEHNARQPARELIARFASALAFSEEPLSRQQFESFQQLLFREKAVSFGSTGPEVNWNVVEAAARKALTPAQQPASDALRAILQFEEAYSRAFAASQPSSAAKP